MLQHKERNKTKMGNTYTVCFMMGSETKESIGTESLLKALFWLFFYKPKDEYAWKSLDHGRKAL
jgi:hypothetical protein